ncbi:MAG TPA: hypothetical protein VGS19_30440 [Streptosporangiaceae bacterium]|nr:hypothetical protein [Streptosporangiaceae bacterium]
MNDEEVAALVKQPFAQVHASTPLEEIVHRGRGVRRRRRFTSLASVAAVAGAATIAATTLLPSLNSSPVTLAAWTVAIQPNHEVVVKINQLRDPAGLQRKLRADGVPAVVRFNNQNPPECLYYPGSPRQIFRLTGRIFPEPSSAQIQDSAAFTIEPTAIPRGVGLWITVTSPQRTSSGNGLYSVSFSTGEALVYASGRCPSP